MQLVIDQGARLHFDRQRSQDLKAHGGRGDSLQIVGGGEKFKHLLERGMEGSANSKGNKRRYFTVYCECITLKKIDDAIFVKFSF